MNNKHTNRGFTILLAALVSSIVLALGISVFELAQKSIFLSGMGRDSQYAFYTADTAAECALYWDIRYNYFGTTPPPEVVSPEPQCDGQSLTVSGRQAAPPYTMSFQFQPGGYCAQVTVTKNALTPKTVIHADGFSVSCANLGSSRSLQRSVELRY